MWSRGDVMKAISTLEKLFSQLGKWDDEKDNQETKEDKDRARKALVSMVWAFREEAEQRWRSA